MQVFSSIYLSPKGKRTMKRYRGMSELLAMNLALGLLAGALRAAEPGAKAEAPARQIKFVLEDEPLVFEVPSVPGLSGKTQLPEGTFYVAVVRGYAPMLIGNQGQGFHAVGQQNLRILTMPQSTPAAKRFGAFMDDYGHGRRPFRFQSRLVEDATTANDLAPVKHVVLHDINFIDMFNSVAGNANLQLESFRLAEPGTPTPLQEYDFAAGTIEDAKRIAQDFLTVHDENYVRRLIAATQKTKAVVTAARDEVAPKVAEAAEQMAVAEAELKGVEPLAEAVNDLKVKRTLLKVELAGIKARINTISEKLTNLDKPGQAPRGRRYDQLVDLKVTAEIDLASLAAEQEVLDELLDGQRRLGELNSKRPRLKALRERMEGLERNLSICDALLADLIPFQLVNDTIVIRPVKFVVAGEQGASE
jgi:hypothetical protein